LKKLKIYGNSTTGFYDRVVTFREFLEKFSPYDISFAIELKGAGVEEDSLRMIEEFGLLERTTFTSFYFDYIKKIKELNPKARVGWLIGEVGEDKMNDLMEIGGEELAPKAEDITEELMTAWRANGLGVRAWGVLNIALMKKMCRLGVDGMTVNFPDRLSAYLHA